MFVSAVGAPPRWLVEKLHSAGIPVRNSACRVCVCVCMLLFLFAVPLLLLVLLLSVLVLLLVLLLFLFLRAACFAFYFLRACFRVCVCVCVCVFVCPAYHQGALQATHTPRTRCVFLTHTPPLLSCPNCVWGSRAPHTTYPISRIPYGHLQAHYTTALSYSRNACTALLFFSCFGVSGDEHVRQASPRGEGDRSRLRYCVLPGRRSWRAYGRGDDFGAGARVRGHVSRKDVRTHRGYV